MINMSSTLKQYLRDNRYCSWRIDMEFLDGRSVSLDGTDLPMGSGEITIGAGNDSLTIGNCLSKTLRLDIFNLDYQYDDYDFYGAVLNVFVDYDLTEYGGETETLHIGKFTVTEPEEYGTVISLVAYDDFYKTDKESAITVKDKTVKQIFTQACTSCGLLPSTYNYQYSNYVVTKELETELTYRQLIGFCAMVMGGNAVVKDGTVSIITYSYISNAMGDGADGGGFFTNVDNLNGGVFSPWEVAVVFDSGTFEDIKDVFTLNDAINRTMATDSVTITGVKLNCGDEYSAGTEGYVLSVENPLAEGNPTTAVTYIYNSVKNLRFRTCEVDIPSYPAAEICDQCYIVDHKGTYFSTFITDLTIAFNGYTTIKCSAKSPIRNATKYANSYQNDTIQKARNVIKKDITDHDTQVSRIGDLIAKSMGLHLTMERDGSGGNVYKLHDKPLLADSQNVFLINSEGFFVSNSGDHAGSYVAGFDSSGNAVLNLLSVVGLTANWIKTGTLSLGGVDNTKGEIKIYDYEGTLGGEMDKDGFTMYGSGIKTSLKRRGVDFYTGSNYETHLGYVGHSVYRPGNNNGLAFMLDDPNGIMSWAFRESSEGDYNTRMVYAPKDIYDTSGDLRIKSRQFTMYADINMNGNAINNANFVGNDISCETNIDMNSYGISNAKYRGTQDFYTHVDMHGYSIKDALLINPSIGKSGTDTKLTIGNNVDVNVYSHVNMQGYSISNARLYSTNVGKSGTATTLNINSDVSLSIKNNASVDIYTPINMHGYKISNANLDQFDSALNQCYVQLSVSKYSDGSSAVTKWFPVSKGIIKGSVW